MSDALVVVLALAVLMGGGIIVIDTLIIRRLRRQHVDKEAKGGRHADRPEAADSDGQPGHLHR